MCVDCVGPTIILGGYQNTTGSANGRYFETRFCEGFFNYFFYLEFFRDVRFCWFRSFRGGWRWESRKKDPGIKPRPITGYYWGFSPSGLRIWLRKTFGSGTGWKRMHKKTEKPFTGHFLKTFSIEIWNNYYLRSKAGFFFLLTSAQTRYTNLLTTVYIQIAIQWSISCNTLELALLRFRTLHAMGDKNRKDANRLERIAKPSLCWHQRVWASPNCFLRFS